jgi:hypothetical protein
MFEAATESLDHESMLRYLILGNGDPLSYIEALERWQHDATFRAFFISMLAAAPYVAFRWETPPVTSATAQRPFEFVLLDCPGLAVPPDESAFEACFAAAGEREEIVAFPSLGKDAYLVAPTPRATGSAYGHLAAFSRLAPRSQNHALWCHVGHAMLQRLGEEPVWLSTAGMAIPWLHVRLDSRPKYYGYRPYRSMACRFRTERPVTESFRRNGTCGRYHRRTGGIPRRCKVCRWLESG